MRSSLSGNAGLLSTNKIVLTVELAMWVVEFVKEHVFV